MENQIISFEGEYNFNIPYDKREDFIEFYDLLLQGLPEKKFNNMNMQYSDTSLSYFLVHIDNINELSSEHNRNFILNFLRKIGKEIQE